MHPVFWYLETTDGATVRMKDGLPFHYTTPEMANIGRRILSKELDRQLLVKEYKP